jgi:hypothetical protein
MVWVRERTIPTEQIFADKGCHVVSVTDLYVRILGQNLKCWMLAKSDRQLRCSQDAHMYRETIRISIKLFPIFRYIEYCKLKLPRLILSPSLYFISNIAHKWKSKLLNHSLGTYVRDLSKYKNLQVNVTYESFIFPRALRVKNFISSTSSIQALVPTHPRNQ